MPLACFVLVCLLRYSWCLLVYWLTGWLLLDVCCWFESGDMYWVRFISIRLIVVNAVTWKIGAISSFFIWLCFRMHFSFSLFLEWLESCVVLDDLYLGSADMFLIQWVVAWYCSCLGSRWQHRCLRQWRWVEHSFLLYTGIFFDQSMLGFWYFKDLIFLPWAFLSLVDRFAENFNALVRFCARILCVIIVGASVEARWRE